MVMVRSPLSLVLSLQLLVFSIVGPLILVIPHSSHFIDVAAFKPAWGAKDDAIGGHAGITREALEAYTHLVFVDEASARERGIIADVNEDEHATGIEQLAGMSGSAPVTDAVRSNDVTKHSTTPSETRGSGQPSDSSGGVWLSYRFHPGVIAAIAASNALVDLSDATAASFHFDNEKFRLASERLIENKNEIIRLLKARGQPTEEAKEYEESSVMEKEQKEAGMKETPAAHTTEGVARVTQAKAGSAVPTSPSTPVNHGDDVASRSDDAALESDAEHISDPAAAVSVSDPSPPFCLTIHQLLGSTVHTLQDFYSHSNWVELHGKEREKEKAEESRSMSIDDDAIQMDEEERKKLLDDMNRRDGGADHGRGVTQGQTDMKENVVILSLLGEARLDDPDPNFHPCPNEPGQYDDSAIQQQSNAALPAAARSHTRTHTHTETQLHGLTSGYFDIPDWCTVPLGKCRHGGVGYCSDGLNKDDASRPNYSTAYRAAERATRRFIHRIVTHPNVRNNHRALRCLFGQKAHRWDDRSRQKQQQQQQQQQLQQ